MTDAGFFRVRFCMTYYYHLKFEIYYSETILTFDLSLIPFLCKAK